MYDVAVGGSIGGGVLLEKIWKGVQTKAGCLTLASCCFIIRWMEDHARRWGHDVTLTNTTDDTAVLGVAGPKSRDLLSKLTSTDLSNKAFPFMTSQKVKLAGVDIMALRISYTGK